MKKPHRPAKTLAFRFPFLASQRSNIKDCRHHAGTSGEKLSPDSLVITGKLKKPGALSIAPVFPGEMRFSAADKLSIPKPADVLFDGDDVQPAFLRSLGKIAGTLIIEVQAQGMLSSMIAAGKMPAMVVPTLAYYGPISFGEAFLSDALLDPKGLSPSTVKVNGKVLAPGSKEWKRAVLTMFLSGDYRPWLRAGATLATDDAERLPMPSVVLGRDFAGQVLPEQDSFAVAITFAASNGSSGTPSDLAAQTTETVPTDAFLRHVASKMREPVLSKDVDDPVLKEVLQDEDSSQPWTARLLASLGSLGFGAKAQSTPAEMAVREFQFSASRDTVAKAIDPALPPLELARRDFRHLEQSPNPDPYRGFISGLADRRTRGLIADWTRGPLRNPLLMPVFLGAEDHNVPPVGDPVEGCEDVWNRHEMKIGLGRVFAADFSRTDLAGGRISHRDLQIVGRYRTWGAGGPITMVPSPTIRVDSAEVKPLVMFGIDEAKLINVLADRAKSDPGLVKMASSFRVIRSVSEVESLGYLDTINAYDGAGISLAPYHWAMADAGDSPEGTTELGGFSSLFADLHDRGIVAEDVFASLGLRSVGGRAAGHGKFIGTLKFLDNLGKPRTMNPDGPNDYMPSWRSVHRWRQSGQSNSSYAKAAWVFALVRLAAVFHTILDVPAIACDRRPHGPEGPTIGSVFTSELLAAMILRWHVKAPKGVIQGDNKATLAIRAAYKAAGRSVAAMGEAKWKDAAVWEGALKPALLDALKAFIAKPGNEIHKELIGNMSELESPTWIDGTSAVIPAGNKYGYTLDPRLRTLNGPFALAQ